MRISDWSSDVCSSDLHQAADDGAAQDGERQNGACADRFFSALGHSAVLATPGDAWPALSRLRLFRTACPTLGWLCHGGTWLMDRSPSQAALRRRWVRLAWGLNRDPQIGRASWRERVCQYV